MMFTNKVYDILKWITLIGLPALGTLYVALAGIWGFPYGDQVASTIVAVVLFLGALLQLSNVQYRSYSANGPMTDEQISSRMNPK